MLEQAAEPLLAFDLASSRELDTLDPLVAKTLVRPLRVIRTGDTLPTIARLAWSSTAGTRSMVAAS